MLSFFVSFCHFLYLLHHVFLSLPMSFSVHLLFLCPVHLALLSSSITLLGHKATPPPLLFSLSSPYPPFSCSYHACSTTSLPSSLILPLLPLLMPLCICEYSSSNSGCKCSTVRRQRKLSCKLKWTIVRLLAGTTLAQSLQKPAILAFFNLAIFQKRIASFSFLLYCKWKDCTMVKLFFF